MTAFLPVCASLCAAPLAAFLIPVTVVGNQLRPSTQQCACCACDRLWVGEGFGAKASVLW